MAITGNRKRAGLTIVLVSFFALLAMASDEADFSSADCRPEEVRSEVTVLATEAGPDAGYNVHVTVSNQGQRGQVRVGARLSTSEGEWSKERHQLMEAGARETLSFTFPEPTINATDVRSFGSCSP
jgi:hypothetical protein